MVRPYLILVIFLTMLVSSTTYAQQDVVFHLNNELLNGKTILKIKHDFHDTYLWVLAKNNEVYRVNTNTLTVDNYTDQFAAYSNLQFIDIAGRSGDTVYIATNSSSLIQYRAATVDQVTFSGNTLTSVGVDYTRRLDASLSNIPYGNALMVGTTNGLYRYNMDTGESFPGSDPVYSKVFEATYRRDMYSGTRDYMFPDTINYFPITFNTPLTTYSAYLWLNRTTFGNDLRTAFYVPYGFMAVSYPYGENIFWGTEKGMSQVNANYSYNAQWPGGHYLNNIPVNKITDIFGLAAFGGEGLGVDEFNPDTGLVRQNLLIGTDKGLYYSTSLLSKFQKETFLRDFTLFHYDELGTIRVNDICVNNESTAWPVCEDGVWVACDNGLYLLKPDYAQFLNNRQLDAVSFNGYADTVGSIKICSGTTATAQIGGDYSGNSFQWYKNGNEIPGGSLDSLVINTLGDYYAVLYDPCQNIHIESNRLHVDVISSPVFTFNYPDKLQYCDSTSTTLKIENNPQYRYRWYTNGVLNGGTSYQYTVTQNGKYKVEVSACTNSWVPSKEIEVDLINLPLPVITADKSKYCAGDNAVLTASTSVDPTYTINWYKDDNLISDDQNQTNITVTTGGNYSVKISSVIASCISTSNTLPVNFTPAPIFTFNYPDKLQYCAGTPVTLAALGNAAYQYRWYTNGSLNGTTTPSMSITQSGTYKVEVSACDGSWVPSKEVEVDFISIPAPVIKEDKAAYCMGDNATLSLALQPDASYTINWFRNNAPLDAYKNQSSITTHDPGAYTVTVAANSANTDGTVCSQTSPVQNVVFNTPPTVSIQKITTTTLCDGQTIDLKVSYDNGTVQWSNGESADEITVSQSGTYTATVTSAAGCSQSTNTQVQFYPNPVLNIPTYGVCIPAHKTATITAPTNMSSYVWNGRTGSNTFTVDHPQTVMLTVTDANGCQASQNIQVIDDCPNISIPNTFTPNGDGINDTWDITGLEYDPTAMVSIFSRYGQQVYQSRGYKTPWDGTMQGKRLSSGTYYYIIKTKNDTQTYSGYVTILY